MWLLSPSALEESSLLCCFFAAQSCLTLSNPMKCSMPGFPVHYQPSELAKTHVHWVGNAIHPSHPLLLPSSAFNLSQHQGLFQWVGSSHQVAKVSEFWFQASVLLVTIQGWFPLELTGLFSLQSKGLSRVFSSTTVQRHQFLGGQPILLSSSHIHTWLLEKPQLWLYGSL